MDKKEKNCLLFPEIGKSNLSAQIARSGIKQEYIANKLYISPSVISKWKKGASVPDPDQVKILAEILECTEDYIWGSSTDPELTEKESKERAWLEYEKHYPEIIQAKIDLLNKLPRLSLSRYSFENIGNGEILVKDIDHSNRTTKISYNQFDIMTRSMSDSINAIIRMLFV